MHAAPEVSGRLYEDAGDGYGASRLTVLRGRMGHGVLQLEREVTGDLPRVRDEEVVRVYGLPYASNVTGAKAHHFEGGVLEMRVPGDWTRLTVDT